MDGGIIGIIEECAYRINYNVVIQIPTASLDNTFNVIADATLNQLEIPNFKSNLEINSDNYYHFSGVIYRNLKSNDRVGLMVKADKAAPFTCSNVFLTVEKICDEPLVTIRYSSDES